MNTSSPTPYVFLVEAVHDLGAYLELWRSRGEGPGTAAARTAASVAVERIDRALRLLHDLRGQLVAEIRESDRAALKLDEPPADDNGAEG